MERLGKLSKTEFCYKNSFGAVDGYGIHLYRPGRKQTIKFKDIIQLNLMKTQYYHFNFLAFVLALSILVYVKYNSLSTVFEYLLLVLSFFLLIGSYFFKYFKYSFLVVRKQGSFRITVGRKLKQEALNLVNQSKRILSEKGYWVFAFGFWQLADCVR